MKRHDPVATRFQAPSLQRVPLASFRQQGQQRVDHHVAHQVHLRVGMPFATEILDPGRLRDQQQIRQRIGHQPVDFLRHRPIEAAQSRLDVRHRDPQFGGGQGGGQRGIHVADNNQPIERLAARRPLLEELLATLQNAGGLFPVSTGSHRQEHIRLAHSQLFEEDAR